METTTRPVTPPMPDYEVHDDPHTWPIYHMATWGTDNGRWLVFASRVVPGEDDAHYAWRIKAPGEFQWEMVPTGMTWAEAIARVNDYIKRERQS